MNFRSLVPVALTVALVAGTPAAGQTNATTPLRLGDAVRLATSRRAEIEAARARARAGEARPTIVSALEEPMIAPSLDHLPFMFNGADVSFTIEQRFPLSCVRQHRRDSALADLARLRAEATTTTLDVGLEAAISFLMVVERRRMADVLTEQLAIARDVAGAADARYAGGEGQQGDVLRAEVDVARFESELRRVAGEVRSAEAMFNASLGLDPQTPVPPLVADVGRNRVPAWADVRARLSTLPELAAAQAGIARANAEVQVMRDMYRPMATVRTGPSYTMTDGRG
jgi:outer membrane protein TolC